MSSDLILTERSHPRGRPCPGRGGHVPDALAASHRGTGAAAYRPGGDAATGPGVAAMRVRATYNTPAAIPVAGSAEGGPPPSRAGKGTRRPSFLALLTAEALPPRCPASHAAGSTARRGLPLPAGFDFSIQTFSFKIFSPVVTAENRASVVPPSRARGVHSLWSQQLFHSAISKLTFCLRGASWLS